MLLGQVQLAWPTGHGASHHYYSWCQETQQPIWRRFINREHKQDGAQHLCLDSELRSIVFLALKKGPIEGQVPTDPDNQFWKHN